MHGWGISPKFMEFQTAGLKKALPYLDLHYLEAPYDVPPSYILDEKVKQYTPDNKFKSWKDAITEDLLVTKKPDFSESVNALVRYIKEFGPFDGIMGFSLAGFVVLQFLEKLEGGEIQLDQPIKFAMFISINYDKHIPKVLKTPSIHVVGTRDELLFGANILNSSSFLNPFVIVHSEGHKFPRLSQGEIDQLNDFLKPFRRQAMKAEAEKKAQSQRPKL